MKLTTQATLLVALLMSSNAKASEATPPSAFPIDIETARNLLIELQQHGYLYIDDATGDVTLNRSVLQVLKYSGLAKERVHSDTEFSACGKTDTLTLSK